MKIGLRMGPVNGKVGDETAIKWAAELGLDVVDVPRLDENMAALVKAHDLGIGTFDVPAIGQLLSADAAKRDEATGKIQDALRTAAKNGGKVAFICLVPEDRNARRADTFEIWKQAFPAVVKTAEEVGVKLALEPWPGGEPAFPTIGCTPEMWRAMFAAIPSENLGLCFDPSHLIRLGIDYLRAFEEFHPRIHHVHGKDCEIDEEGLYLCGNIGPTFGGRYGFGSLHWRYTIPGYGDADWAKLLFRLDHFKYEGAVCIELEDERFWGTPERMRDGIERAAGLLRDLA